MNREIDVGLDDSDDSARQSTSIGCSPLTRRRKRSVVLDKPSPKQSPKTFRLRKVLDALIFSRSPKTTHKALDEQISPPPPSDEFEFDFATSKTQSKEINDAEDIVSLQLDVRINHGEQLPIKDACGTSDPYVKIRRNEHLIYKTATVFKSLNPNWDERFSLLIDDVSTPLVIDVFDYDRFSVDDFMGTASVELRTIKWCTPTDCVVELCDEHQKSAGRISLTITVTPMTKSEADEFVNRRSKRERDWVKNVNVVLVEGRNICRYGSDGNSDADAFVKFRLGAEKYKSKVCSTTSQPKWLEQFDMRIYGDTIDSESHLLKIACFDRNDCILLGQIDIDVESLNKDKTVERWYELESEQIEGDICEKRLLLLITVTEAKRLTKSSKVLAAESSYDIGRTLSDLSNIGTLVVKVFGADGLQAKDFGGKSDPFAVVELVNTRAQTHTVYRTLQPRWNRIFIFNVKDIHTCLVITVNDEDANNRYEFLGRISIPLITINNGERRWYALKDEKMRKRVKGEILLEFELNWNPIRAAIRTFRPKEKKYIAHEQKFKASLFRTTVLELKDVAVNVLSYADNISFLLSWQSKPKSFAALCVFVLFVYNFEIYFIPIIILSVFGLNYIRKQSKLEETPARFHQQKKLRG